MHGRMTTALVLGRSARIPRPMLGHQRLGRYTAQRTASSRLSQVTVWFQLAKMRLTIYRSSAVNSSPTVAAGTAGRSLPRRLTRRGWREPHEFCPAVHRALERGVPEGQRSSRAAASWHQSLSFDTARRQPIHNQGCAL